MPHPFAAIPVAKRKRIFLPLLAATIVIFVVWVISVIPMANEAAPLSVSSFGMAGNPARAQEMMASWDEPARLSGAFGIGFDFLNLVFYATTFSMACVWVAQVFRARGWYWLSSAGLLIAWGQGVAVLYGTAQNAVMMALLLRAGGEDGLGLSYWATLCKLILLTLGPVYATLGALVWLATRSERR